MKSIIGSLDFSRATSKLAPAPTTKNPITKIKQTTKDSLQTTLVVDKSKAPVRLSGIKTMTNRNRMVNKLALVLISLIVLELILIGDQVQPVKAIKKKIYLKKLKKLLPLFALVKPKKKIILLPIPIPMFKSHPSTSYPNARPHQMTSRPAVMMTTHQSQYPGQVPPMSYLMMDNGEMPQLPSAGFMMEPSSSGAGSALPMTMAGSNSFEPIIREPTTTSTTTTTPAASPTGVSGANASEIPLTMLGPSMVTMTIQSEMGGASNIELSTNLNGQSGALIQQRPYAAKWRPPAHAQRPGYRPAASQLMQHHLQQHPPHQVNPNDDFDEPAGEQYYSSPWAGGRLVSPAKLLRPPKQQQQNWHNLQQQGRLVQQAQPADQQQHHPPQAYTSTRLQFPVGPQEAGQLRAPTRQQQQQQQQLNQALEQEDLVPVGPPQEMPVYQAPNGQLLISLPLRSPSSSSSLPPPPSPSPSPASQQVEQEREPLKQTQQTSADDEVQTQPEAPKPYDHPLARPNGPLQQLKAVVVHRPASAGKQTLAPSSSGRLVSPAVKGKQQKQQQQKEQLNQHTEQKAIPAGGY